MFPRARLIENAAQSIDGRLADILLSGATAVRSRPANDAAAERLNLLVARRRRQNRRDARA